jgi:hypothetical protein
MRTIAAALVVLAAAAPVRAGVVLKQVSVMNAGEKDAMKSTNRIAVDRAGARIDFLEGPPNPLMPVGSYMLMLPDEDGMILVNPAEKTWTRFDPGAMMSALTPMAEQQEQGSGREIAEPVVETLLEEDGGTILGRPTRHFRWHTKFAISMNMPMGMSMITETDSIEDVWVTDYPLDAKTMRNLEGMASGVQVPEQYRKLVDAAKSMQKGLPLKRVTVGTTKLTGTGMMAKMMKRAGDDKPHTTTMEIVELDERPVPAAEFAIPAGYSETDFMSPGMKMPDMNQPPR